MKYIERLGEDKERNLELMKEGKGEVEWKQEEKQKKEIVLDEEMKLKD